MGIIDSAIDAFRFKDTIFLKEKSDLQDKYIALDKLYKEHPENEELKNEYNIVKKGLEGENEIEYQLKKSSIGMYVIRDAKYKYEDLTAQIDFVVITPVFTYYIECKNLTGNVTVNEKGDFIREYTFNGKKVRKGMYSPLRQAEAQREVIRKIWESNASKFKKLFASNNFNYYRRVLVVAANHDTILNTDKAPDNMKYKILRSDNLIRQIQYDYDHRDSMDIVSLKNEMKDIAESYERLIVNEDINYYDYYKNKYFGNDDTLRERLIEFRNKRAKEMNIPAYFVFTNDELERIIKLKPKTLDELEKSNILKSIKFKVHGEKIIKIINGK